MTDFKATVGKPVIDCLARDVRFTQFLLVRLLRKGFEVPQELLDATAVKCYNIDRVAEVYR